MGEYGSLEELEIKGSKIIPVEYIVKLVKCRDPECICKISRNAPKTTHQFMPNLCHLIGVEVRSRAFSAKPV